MYKNASGEKNKKKNLHSFFFFFFLLPIYILSKL